MKLLLTISLTIVFSYPIFAQKKVKIDMAKIEQFTQEIYKDCHQYLNANHLEIDKAFLKHIELVEANEKFIQKTTYKSISTLILRNKCNVDLNYDNITNFDKENFNPLKYFFPRVEKKEDAIYYRIDGTNYFVRLLPY